MLYAVGCVQGKLLSLSIFEDYLQSAESCVVSKILNGDGQCKVMSFN